MQDDVQNNTGFVQGEVATGERRIYRVETFIIPKRNNIYRSSEELDVESHSDLNKEEGVAFPCSISSEVYKTDDVEIASEIKLGVEQQQQNEVTMYPEFPRLSAASSELVLNTPEFALQEINSREKIGEPEISLRHPAEEETTETLDRSLENFTGVEEKENTDVRQFLRFDYNNSTVNFKEKKPIVNIERSQSFDFLPSPRHPSNLKSIKESCEAFYGSCEDLCHHGNKNGCTVTALSPNQISGDIFKENWMQRLEYLQQRVSLIRDKEVILQERERLLLKKEKELRILERLVKEKIHRAEEYLKRCERNSLNLENENLHVFPDFLSQRPSPPPYPEGRKIIEQNDPKVDAEFRETSTGSRTSNRSSRSKGSNTNSTRSEISKGDDKDAKETGRISADFNGDNSKTLQSHKSIPTSESRALNSLKKSNNASGSQSNFQRSKWSAYSSWRCRAKPRVSYDDLDSTLSADIGDSSFAVTSKKFDPRLVRKPRGFSRSASERGSKNRPCSLDLELARELEGERVLRKISENITAVTQSQETRFLDYGSIDKAHEGGTKTNTNPTIKKPGLLDVQCAEIINHSVKDHSRPKKERTSFWNEEASDWLRKKRLAYNLATKRMVNCRDYENDKENSENPRKHKIISEKCQTTKNDKGKKFTIFR